MRADPDAPATGAPRPLRRAVAPRTVVAAAAGVVLLALSGRYGYHRDELYFLQCGRHLAWGYPDQPPLVPLLSRLMSAVAPDSTVALRLPSTVAGAAEVWLAGLMARDLGADRRGEWTASVATALCGFVLATSHLLSTSTYALLGTVAATAVAVRLLRSGGTARRWLTLAVVVGVTAEADPVPVAVVAAIAVSLLVLGPRTVLRGRWPWVAVAVAAALIAPYVGWQAAHGFPQVAVARGIASGASTSSVPRALFVPFLFLQAGPWLAVLWVPGLVRLLRDPALRALGAGFLLSAVLFVAGGGKPYYLAGMLPLLLAAGAQPLVDRLRVRWLAVGAVLSLPTVVFTLPVLPVADLGAVVAVNPDAAETVGWPSFVAQVTAAAGPGTPVLGRSYGEAGAVARYDPSRRAFSPQFAYGSWGPPPGSVTVLAVGLTADQLRAACSAQVDVGVVRMPYGLGSEDGRRLVRCTPPRPWAEVWPRLRTP